MKLALISCFLIAIGLSVAIVINLLRNELQGAWIVSVMATGLYFNFITTFTVNVCLRIAANVRKEIFFTNMIFTYTAKKAENANLATEFFPFIRRHTILKVI